MSATASAALATTLSNPLPLAPVLPAPASPSSVIIDSVPIGMRSGPGPDDQQGRREHDSRASNVTVVYPSMSRTLSPAIASSGIAQNGWIMLVH